MQPDRFKSSVGPRAAVIAILLSATLLLPASSNGAVSYSQSVSVSAATGSASPLGVIGQSFVPIYDPNYANDGPGGPALMMQYGLHYDLQAPTSAASPVVPAALSASANPGQYAEIQVVKLQTGNVAFNWFANAHAQASVSISGNSMHGTAQAMGSTTPVSYTYTDDQDSGQIAYNPLGAKSVARGVATIADRLTITSATLPFGTPVQIQVMATVHAQVTDPEMDLDYQFNNHFGSVYTLAALSGQVGPVNISTIVAADAPFSNPTQTTVFNSTVGATFNATESMVVQALGIATHYQLGSVTIYDNEALAGNTSYVNILPLTSGVSLLSDAGIDYAAVPVPEPRASLLGAVVLVLVTCRRCRIGAPQMTLKD